VQNPQGKDHSVFVAFAPRENPKIAIAVVVENAGFGATWSAPIASLLVEKYINKKINRPQAYMDRLINANLLPSSEKVLRKTDSAKFNNNKVITEKKLKSNE
jgi:penicillin-binding protein 2